MASMRLSSLWKKVKSALVKMADGRVRPVKDWTELTAPESESPDAERDVPEQSEEYIAEPLAETQQSTEVSLDAPHAEEMLSGVTKLPGGEWAVSYDPDYLFQQQEKAREQETTGEGIEDSMLLDPSERRRVVELFKKWDPEFLAQPHEATGVPALSGREQTMVKRKQEDLAKKHADVVQRLEAEEGKKGKNPIAIKNLYKELDAVIAEMADFNKKYSKESQEAERLKGLENLAEGETAEERAQVAPHQFPGEFDKSPEALSADKKLEKELEDFTAAGGLFGKLMSKKDDKLNDLEKGNLGVVLQGLGSLLSRRQLNYVTVRKLISALRALTGKFSASIKSDADLSDKVSEVAYLVGSRKWGPGEGQSESSAQASWHGNDPLRISIISRLQVHAGGRKPSLRDKMIGKKPENITHAHGLTPADISTGISAFSPRYAFDELILKGPARPGFDKAISDVMSGGDSESVFAAAGAEAYEVLKDEYASLYGEMHGEFQGSLTGEHYVYDPENPEGKAEQPIPRDLKKSFVAEYSELAQSVLSRLMETAGQEGVFEYSPGGQTNIPDYAFMSGSADPEDAEDEAEGRRRYEEYTKTTGVPPFIRARTIEHMIGMEKALEDFEFNPETGKYELKPEPKKSESRELSDEEKAARTRDILELREKLAKPLTREILYDKSGELRDVKDLFVDLPEDKHGDLHVLLQDELAAANATPGAEELAEQLSDSIEQLDRMMAPRE